MDEEPRSARTTCSSCPTLRRPARMSILDHLSRGRLRLGIGRGLARRELEAFRGTMDESRERFDEAFAMIMRALRTGLMEGDGPFYRQPRTEIRPRPARAFDGRVYAVASSDDSVVSAARLDARMVMFADRPWPIRMLADFCVCTPSLDGAEATARRYMGKFVESNFYHYELLSDFELATSFRFGGTPFDLAESGLRLYAKEVMPVVRSWR